MRKLTGLPVLVLAVSFAILQGAAAQDYTDARELVKASYEKSGGDKWKTVESMVMSSNMTIDSPQGEMAGSAKLTFLFPGYMHARILLDIDDGTGMPMGPITQVMTPDTGYVHTDQGSQGLPGGNGPDSATDEIDLLADGGPELSLEKSELDGKEVYKVTAVADDETSAYYYDIETLQRVAKEVQTPGGSNWIRYSDFKDLNGLLVPHKQVQDLVGGMKQTLTMKTIEINSDIDREGLFGKN